MTGWIKIHRSLFTSEWEWFGDGNTTLLFICLITMANHKETNWRGQVIPRGSLLTGRKQLSEATGLTERSVRTSLKKLKTTSKVTIKTTNRYSVISIKNYDLYQQNDQQNANKRPTSDQQVTTSKNDKNVKNDKKRRRDLTQNDFSDISEKYNVPISFVLSKWDDLQNYCDASGKRYKNYKAALSKWVKKDAIERIDDAKSRNNKAAIDLSEV